MVHREVQNQLRLARNDGIAFINSRPLPRVIGNRPGHVRYNLRLTVYRDNGIDKDAVAEKIPDFAKGKYADVTRDG